MVFSVEQIRCVRLPKAEPESPAITPEDCGIADMCDSDPESAHLTDSSQPEVAGSNPSSSGELFLKLKEKPEELLQLAPQAGDAVVPLTGERDSQRGGGSKPDPVARLINSVAVRFGGADVCQPCQSRHGARAPSGPVQPTAAPAAHSHLRHGHAVAVAAVFIASLFPRARAGNCADVTLTESLLVSFNSTNVLQSPCEEEDLVMDTSQVEKFFAVFPDDHQKEQTQAVRAAS